MRITNWQTVLNINEPQLAYSNFQNIFMQCYESCFPIKRKSSVYKSRKPWLSNGLIKSIKTKNQVYVKYLRRPTLTNRLLYKQSRNKLNMLMHRVEREYHDNDLSIDTQKNLRKSWEMLNFLSCNAIYKQCVLVMMYKFNTGLLPDALNYVY